VYEEPVAPADLADRDDAAALLADRLRAARNSRLEAPRRYGKTSLLRRVLAEVELDGLVPVYVNFLGVLTVADVAERIERAYGEQLESPLRRWFAGLVRTLRPTVSARAPGGAVSAGVAPAAPDAGLLDRLAVPRRLHEKHGRRCAIVLDEFQDVLRAGPELDGTIRSELERHGEAAGYVFSGSHPGLMRDLFASRRRAFFGQAAPVELGPLHVEDLAPFITDRFAALRRDPGDALGPLLDLAQGHPQRAMLLAHHLFVATGPGEVADSDTWSAALAAACREVNGEITTLWERLPTTERRLVSAIADRQVGLFSRQATTAYGLPRTGANRRALLSLRDAGEIVEDREPPGWRVVDPLFALWLRNGRSWPL